MEITVRRCFILWFMTSCWWLAMPATGWAQASANPAKPLQEGGFVPHAKENNATPADKLAEFSAKYDGVYRIGEGDELVLEFWGRPELSGKHVVGPDGNLTLPLTGTLRAAGKSREELAEAAVEALSRFYEDLSATVKVEKYSSNRVFILGRVSRPGMLEFDVPPTLLEALTRAGSLPVGGAGADKAALSRCLIFRGQDQLVRINLKGLLTDNQLALNIRLQRNDVIYIPDSDDQLVYVLGEVKKPGAFPLTPEMSFMSLLALAGGPERDAAASHIQLIRPTKGLNQEIPLGELLKPKAQLNFALEEGDIIYVPKRKLAKFGYVVERITPFISLFILGKTLGQ
ncbi:MAG: SLBB domain-containing protein [Blastocatellia bacterium]|nr:SLBB domain-containing protein [Blastocatellia bacterium]